jgi:hypothetical protein
MIGEIAARLSGGYMSGWTYPYASGAEPCRGAICAALGLPPQGLEVRRNWTSAERAFISIPGLVRSIDGIEEMKGTDQAFPGVKDLFLRAAPGQRLSFPENNVSKAGNVISAAPRREEAVRAAEEAARRVLIRLAAPDEETAAFLAVPPGSSPFPPPAYGPDRALLEELAALPEDVPEKSGNYDPRTLGIHPFPGFTASKLRDYGGRSPLESLEAVRKLTGLSLPLLFPGKSEAFPGEIPEKSPALLGRGFWTALIRGGYQGGTYHIDCIFRGTP